MKRTLSIFLAFLHLAVVAVPALATTTNYSYVRAGCTYNGDGDYNYCAASTDANGAYNSMSNWNTGEARDLTSSDEIEYVYFDTESGAADTGFPLSVSSSWGTDSTRYVVWEAVGDHGGNWNTSVYHAESTADTLNALLSIGGSTIDNLKMYGMQFYYNRSSLSQEVHPITLASDAAGYEVHECIFRANSGLNSSNAIYFFYIGRGSATSGTGKFWNNLIYDIANAGTGAGTAFVISYSVSSTVVYSFYNNTFVNLKSYGIYQPNTNATVYSYNNGCSSCSALKNANVSGGTGDSTSTPTFVGGGDYHLASSDTTWKDQTSDQSSGLFSDDIDGESRTGSWDIGADEYVAAGGGGQVIMYSRLLQAQWR